MEAGKGRHHTGSGFLTPAVTIRNRIEIRKKPVLCKGSGVIS